jgi:hypothetical protein
MILRLSDSLSRAVAVAAALAVAIWLCFFRVRAATAGCGCERESAQYPETAVRWEPENPDDSYALGRYPLSNLEPLDASPAERSYEKVIELNPVATDAWLDLGTAYELDGKIDKARPAYLEA